MQSFGKRMKRRATRAISAGLLAAALACGVFSQPAFAAAEPAISYSGSSHDLVITSADGDSNPANLFASFTDLMPGDTVTQEVTIDLADISYATRVYIRAGEPQLAGDAGWAALSEDAQKALSQMTLRVELAGEGAVEAAEQSGQPVQVFRNVDASTDEELDVLVASVSSDATITMTLTLSVPTSVGNEMNDLADVKIPWIITVEDDSPSGSGDNPPSSTAELTAAATNVAYEGGMGSSAHEARVDNLPEPEWGIDWDTAAVTVDGNAWDVSEQGLPFQWTYATNEDGHYDVVAYPALRGMYWLLAKPLEGNPAVVVDGKLLTFPGANEDYVVDTGGPNNVAVWVRDVTDDAAADTLASSHFKDVYGSDAVSLASMLSSLMGGSTDAEAAVEPAATGDTALDGNFTHVGTHGGDCDATVAHAHVAAGTTFTKNGDPERPVDDDARVGLLWDDFIAGVLGAPDREGVLDAKARAAVGGVFAADAGGAVQSRFKYLDLVDMNDGNLWVATADQSSVTVFVPYFDSMSAGDKIAVAYFDGLTRDYTIDMGAADLDAEIAATAAHSLQVTKASDGILFDVPYREFGPFELLWIDEDGSGEEPGTDEPGPDGPSDPDDHPDVPDTPDDQTDKPHTDVIPATGDVVPFAIACVGGAGLLLIVAACALRRQHRK